MTGVDQRGQADEIAEAKRALRRQVRLRRERRPPERRAADDALRLDRLIAKLSASTPRRVAAYLSAGSEPDTHRLITWMVDLGTEVIVPVLTDGAGSWLARPAWAVYQGPDHLRAGRSRILEPTGQVLGDDALDTIDLIVLPGVAADLAGNRLGRGGGWYDRARAGHPYLPAWLLLNDDEVVGAVPVDDWDLPVAVIVTPTRTLRQGDPG